MAPCGPATIWGPVAAFVVVVAFALVIYHGAVRLAVSEEEVDRVIADLGSDEGPALATA